MMTTTKKKYKNGYCAAMNHALFLQKFISVHAHPNCMSQKRLKKFEVGYSALIVLELALTHKNVRVT